MRMANDLKKTDPIHNAVMSYTEMNKAIGVGMSSLYIGK